MPQCWFLSFLWKRLAETQWHPVEAVTEDEHPLDFMARARKANPTREFSLLTFHPIPYEVYQRAHDTAPEEIEATG